MHLTAPSHWSRSIGTGGRDVSESVVTISECAFSAAIYRAQDHRASYPRSCALGFIRSVDFDSA